MPAVPAAAAAAAASSEVAMQRRHSSASSDTGSDHGSSTFSNSRHTSQENVSVIPTRTAKVSTSKPPANPLQFVKVGPCDLSRHAQEQLKKAELVKKAKPEKQDEAEDWQSNLDNWKVSRRKRQEHIIERVVEVKKLELEEHDRNRRRSKTFSEMLEDRSIKGRKTSLPVYQDDDNDLSELGLSTSHKSNGVDGVDSVFQEDKDGTQKSNHVPNASSPVTNGQNGHSSRDSSSEQEEYTYERAIQNYVNFTESRNRGRSLTPSDSESPKITNGISKKPSPPVPTKPRRGSCKIEEKLSEFEQIKKKSMSTNDLTESTKKPLTLPKVDILKRREMFEKSQDDDSNTIKNRLSGDFSSSKSIRDRLSSLGKSDDVPTTKKINRMSAEISVKHRLQNIEKQNSFERSTSKSNTSLNENGPPSTSTSVKERLSSLKKASSESKETSKSPQVIKEKSITEDKLPKVTSSLEKRFGKEAEINVVNDSPETSLDDDKHPEPVHEPSKQEMFVEEELRENTALSPTEDLYESKRQQHYRHRSLDSLDVDSTDGLGNESFERVQSLEDLDFCRNYPASSVSGDTDREDSGIHTADVSSSVSQADDCDLHLDAEFQQQPTIFEEINKNPELTSCFIVKQMNQMNVSDLLVELSNEVVPGKEVEENSSSFLKLPLRHDCDPLPVILESPSEPLPPEILKTSPPRATGDSSLLPSHLPVQSGSDPGKSETVVNIDSQTELCNIKLTAFGADCSSPNSLNVENSLTPLPVQISSAEILHDNHLGSVEISQMIDLSGVTSPLPNHTPSVSVQAEYKFEPTEKLGDRMEREIERVRDGEGEINNQLTREIVERETVHPNLPTLPLINGGKVIEGMDAVFPLSPSTLEPPKEKPPPPPTEVSDDDESNSTKPVSLRRLDSTKRIKKEIRQKRSSFLGIEGTNDDNYLEPELELVRRPPDISSFLAEEKRLEQLLYRQSICSESESRDSGVELEKHQDDLVWPPTLHSRDNSETYANTSTTSEEEEMVKKEREIIEMLEREEINRYSSGGQDQENIGEKLAERLRELEAEKARLEWERRTEEAARAEQQSRIQARERELSKQETNLDEQEQDPSSNMLLAERERLQAEQAALARQRDAILQQHFSPHNHNGPVPEPYNHADGSYELSPNHNRSLTDVRVSEMPECRRSMQDLRCPPGRRPPPPIPPSKPLIIPRSQSQERMSSPQQMTRQTLQALSAAPKPRLSDSWLQAKRKPNNYQHWLIQEAEQRRITEHHQRQAPLPRRPVPPPPATNHRASASGGQYANWQPKDKPLPDAIIQTLTQRVQNRLHAQAADTNNNRRNNRNEQSTPEQRPREQMIPNDNQEKMLSVSGKKKCSHCGDELGRGAAMIIESLRLFYHIDCFKCCVCCIQLGDGLMGTDVRVRNNKLHCHNCYSSDDGVKFSCV